MGSIISVEQVDEYAKLVDMDKANTNVMKLVSKN